MRAQLRPIWLFSRPVDLCIVVVPVVLTAVAWIMSLSSAVAGKPAAYASWMAQFVLGNTTHVILTFLLLGTRRDLLHATKNQATIVALGSLATFGVSLAFFWYFEKVLVSFSDLALSAALVFATHHSLSQVKGFWSLYNLRATQAGAEINPRERTAMQHWVSVSLLFTLAKLLFIGKDRRPDAPPYIIWSIGDPGLLPYSATYVLLAGWLVFAAWVLWTILDTRQVSWPKLLYIAVHLAIVGVTILFPVWGLILTSGIHGLEYYFIGGRMLLPNGSHEAGGWLRKAMIVPVMLVVMTPIFVVGLFSGPFAWVLGGIQLEPFASNGRIVVNAVVMAHYFADAFIYRFRIPEVRKVALARLGFLASWERLCEARAQTRRFERREISDATAT